MKIEKIILTFPIVQNVTKAAVNVCVHIKKEKGGIIRRELEDKNLQGTPVSLTSSKYNCLLHCKLSIVQVSQHTVQHRSLNPDN